MMPDRIRITDVSPRGGLQNEAGVITTGACIDTSCQQMTLEHDCRESFDRVSVDAHPSCSDTVVCMASGHAAMNADPVVATLTVGHGPGHGFMLGCDLSAKYVSINADYTT